MTQIEATIIINRGLCLLKDAKYYSTDAVTMLLAIGWQESRFKHRKQIGGPARGFWQFEKNGGVKGVMTHPATSDKAKEMIFFLHNPKAVEDVNAVYQALAKNDMLAAVFARLLLWIDPNPLPTDPEPAWNYYIANWRPGKPHKHTWDDAWNFATQNTCDDKQ